MTLEAATWQQLLCCSCWSADSCAAAAVQSGSRSAAAAAAAAVQVGNLVQLRWACVRRVSRGCACVCPFGWWFGRCTVHGVLHTLSLCSVSVAPVYIFGWRTPSPL
jgi:hypothetical protein